VIRLLRDEALRHKLARNGRALIEVEYTWDRIAQMYEDLYQSVVDQVEC
jgi:glycosyltransferase involved in cell wall biosynthesis